MSRIVLDTLAKSWDVALPIGNGFVGGMVFGGVAHEHVQLNEDTVWSGGPMDRVNPASAEHVDEVRSLLLAGKPTEAERLAQKTLYPTYPHPRHYQSLGDLFIDFESEAVELGEPAGYRRELDLERGVGRIVFSRTEREERRMFFASNPDQVLVYRIEAEGGAPLEFSLRLSRKGTGMERFTSYCDGCRALNEKTLVMWGASGGKDGIEFSLMARVVPDEGEVEAFGGELCVHARGAATIYVAARTSVRASDPGAWCKDVLDRAEAKGYDRVYADHVADYRSLFDRCRVSFSDEGAPGLREFPTSERLARFKGGAADPELISTYFDFGRYLLISSSRAGSLPANLQGIWCGEFNPPWGSKFTVNINLQMNYWPAEACGLGELCEPLFEHIETMYPRGKRVARDMYGARGFCCHHNTDIWGDCAPVDRWPASTPWALGAAWLCLHIVDHYRYAHDLAFARRYFTIVRDAVLFCLDFQMRDVNGTWLSGPSLSPENTYRTEDGTEACLCMAPAMDTQIIRELLGGFTELCDELDIEDELLPVIAERLQCMPEIEIGPNGCIREWREDYEETSLGHRHISHLFALYPGTQIRSDATPDLARAAHATLDRRVENGGGRTGWSKAWMTLLYARLGDAEAAGRHLQGLLTGSSFDNLLCVHPPFQIDGNFGGAAAVMELLVRDYGEVVTLLPALPSWLGTGSTQGVRLRCGAVLDMAWREGQVVSLEVKPARDADIRLDVNACRHDVNLREGAALSLKDIVA